MKRKAFANKMQILANLLFLHRKHFVNNIQE